MGRLYLAYGLLVLGLMGVAQYRGWSLTRVSEAKDVPRSVRDNPGILPLGRTAATTTTREANEMGQILFNNIVNAMVFAVLGIVCSLVAFVVIDKFTPYDLWKEIVQEHNMALAILVGAMSLGICIIIAAADSLACLWAILTMASCCSSPSCSLPPAGSIYELIAGTLASYLLGDSVLQFSTIIGCYLFAMGIGSALSRYIHRGLAYRFVLDRVAAGRRRRLFFRAAVPRVRLSRRDSSCSCM